ncbi:hypothetical protein CEN45_15900 [Fischerella thermalis CCMEE 5198]|nr:hypothetical protein CEN45_15900 [Fischerella thermalis CCMEE 5198]
MVTGYSSTPHTSHTPHTPHHPITPSPHLPTFSLTTSDLQVHSLVPKFPQYIHGHSVEVHK